MLTLGETSFALAPLGLRVLLALLFLYIYRRRREQYLLYWAAGWALLAVRLLVQAGTLGEVGPAIVLARETDSLLLVMGLLLFLDSARAFARDARSPTATAFLMPLFMIWWLLRLTVGGPLGDISLEVGGGVVLLVAARLFWKDSRRREITGGLILAGGFLLWGVESLAAPLAPRLLPYHGPVLSFLLLLPWQIVAFGMLVVLYEEEKRAIERHMLELAGLNLITSTAQHAATVEDMLGQTLARLLGTLRLHAGSFALTLSDTEALSCIHRGDQAFLRELERIRLLPYVHRTVNRLGGLVVLPDLNRPAAPAAFAREEEFQQVAALARSQGVRLLVGVSLRAKTGVCGILLLASPTARHFAPAELRLLLGLGGQVGMAVENFQLLQQSARRTEGLRLLNEIGRALSSVRSLDELLESIHSEIRKVLDVSNLYVALYDARHDEISFELEIKDDVVLPKRRRRAGHGLTEYVLRRQEPLLVQEDFTATVVRLGIEPTRSAQSFLGVPLMLQGQAIGVLAIISYTTPRAFPMESLEVLTVLAAQAAIAIENARLFDDEQKRARQLTLLNNVARKAISTLNPEEMLNAMAGEMYAGMSFDYIALGLLDYVSREVVIQAEGGTGSNALNRRFKLGEGPLGRVAMSGMLEEVDDLEESLDRTGVLALLPAARSLVTLPVVYADQLLGVLHVESAQPHAFRLEDILLLRTLADQLASALHNALTFQKAQEQAITDGLTGVKTHRYFMEALHSEWRRATRVGRSFSLLMIDLDKFKFVNDYFGHLEGDAVLQRAGRILEQNVRRSDVVARYGGDEFVVLMPETNADQAFLLGDKLRQWIGADPLLHDKKTTASLGLATYPQHATTPQELIQVADASMYLSKHQGGNMIVSADHYRLTEQKQWQRHVLEAYLGVTIKRLFATGPEAFEEVYRRLEQVVGSLGVHGDGRELPPVVLETVTSLAFAIDAKDQFTQGHSQSVARYCLQVGRHLNLSEKDLAELRLAAILHDIGKIGVPESVLSKAGELEPGESQQVRQHALLGAKILEPLRAVRQLQAIIRHHHERWDGSGYPDGLSGEAIPLAARLIAIAEAYDTMTTERTYRHARGRQEAIEELRRCAETQFDPKLVEAFIEALSVEVPAEGEQPPVARL